MLYLLDIGTSLAAGFIVLVAADTGPGRGVRIPWLSGHPQIIAATAVTAATLLARLVCKWIDPGVLGGAVVVLLESLMSPLAVIAAIAFFAGKGPNGKGTGAALAVAVVLGLPVLGYLIALRPKVARL